MVFLVKKKKNFLRWEVSHGLHNTRAERVSFADWPVLHVLDGFLGHFVHCGEISFLLAANNNKDNIA